MHGSTRGSVHGSVPVHNDEDVSLVEVVSPVKPKKPSRHATKAKKDEPKKANEAPKEWTVEEEIALCQGWCDVSENNISENSMKAKGFWKAVIRCIEKETGSSRADEAVEETQKFRPMGRDRATAKKKAAGSSHGGSSSFVDLVANKFYNTKQKK
nr:glutathione S-transferase T3-like isoform X3 [Tanacetum cinerariifolium]